MCDKINLLVETTHSTVNKINSTSSKHTYDDDEYTFILNDEYFSLISDFFIFACTIIFFAVGARKIYFCVLTKVEHFDGKLLCVGVIFWLIISEFKTILKKLQHFYCCIKY